MRNLLGLVRRRKVSCPCHSAGRLGPWCSEEASGGRCIDFTKPAYAASEQKGYNVQIGMWLARREPIIFLVLPPPVTGQCQGMTQADIYIRGTMYNTKLHSRRSLMKYRTTSGWMKMRFRSRLRRVGRTLSL